MLGGGKEGRGGASGGLLGALHQARILNIASNAPITNRRRPFRYSAPEGLSGHAKDLLARYVWKRGEIKATNMLGHSLTKYKWPNDGWAPSPSSALSTSNLSLRMLTVDPARRITFEGVLSHPWVRQAPRWGEELLKEHGHIPEPPSLFPIRNTQCPHRWEPLSATSAYMVRVEPATGAVYADEQLLQVRGAGGRGSSLLAYAMGMTDNDQRLDESRL